MSNFMPFVPSDLSANAQPPENAVNEQTDRWTDKQTNNNIHKHPWMLSVSHLDTSACQIVGHFFQALCMQYTNPSPWMVGRTDERMKWQQYPSASMLVKGKSSGNICISDSMPFLPSDLSANVQKPENVVNRPIDGQTDGQTDGQKSGNAQSGSDDFFRCDKFDGWPSKTIGHPWGRIQTWVTVRKRLIWVKFDDF